MKHLFIIALALQNVAAADLHVGKDVPTIAQAIKLAQPGDTIHLEPKVYRDYAGFYGKKGEPGRPITLDGHGARLEGSDPIDPAKWTDVAPGLFKNEVPIGSVAVAPRPEQSSLLPACIPPL